jgi:aspartyl-tRNA(Asn)/glutamyl-tRNA(Gln) amidotransferase subunit A
VLAHIERWEPHIRATYLLRPEPRWRRPARREARWLRGEPLGALDGVPAPSRTTSPPRRPHAAGHRGRALVPAAADAPPAARLREAGAVIVAKTTMPDYGMLSSGLSSFHALARNPWDLSKGPGGSSAGAGAAAAAGYGPLHIGTDIGGSLRLPASWCGIFSLKPSLGRIPIDPPYTGRAAGPMTRTVADAALMMQVLSQPDARDSMACPRRTLPGASLTRGVSACGPAHWPAAGRRLRPAGRARGARRRRAGRPLAGTGRRPHLPMQPFMTQAMLDGMDHFWRMRSHIDLQALPAGQRDKVLPYIRAWADSAAGMSGTEVFHASQQFHLTRVATVQAPAARSTT